MGEGLDQERGYLTPEEAADRLGLAKPEVERWCEEQGRPHGVWFLSGTFLMPASALETLRGWSRSGTDDR